MNGNRSVVRSFHILVRHHRRIHPRPRLIHSPLRRPSITVRAVSIHALMYEATLPTVTLGLICFTRIPPFKGSRPNPFLQENMRMLLTQSGLRAVHRDTPVRTKMLPLTIPNRNVQVDHHVRMAYGRSVGCSYRFTWIMCGFTPLVWASVLAHRRVRRVRNRTQRGKATVGTLLGRGNVPRRRCF